MYYIIETNYVGPNADQHIDDDLIEIKTVPARTNCSHEVCLDGWRGTTNDWSVHAHGEYATLEAARAAITEKFGDVRNLNESESYAGYSGSDEIIETYKPGLYEPMSQSATGDWLYGSMRCDVAADTTDDRLAELLTEYEGDANSEGYALDSSAGDMMREYREELRDELNKSA